MGIRKKGNRWVTDEEHAKEEEGEWKIAVILGILVLCGWLANNFLLSHGVEKTYRFIGVVVASLVGGGFAAIFFNRIMQLIALLFFVVVAILIGAEVWKNI